MHLYLHVGLHKTGTTAIQKQIFYNRDYFRSLGLGYLSTEANNSMSVYSAFCDEPEKYHINVRRGINTKKQAFIHNSALLERIEDEIRSAKTQLFVISGEDISHLSSGNIERLRDFLQPLVDKITVVAYVRAPRDMITSNCAQAIKGGFTFEGLRANLPKPLYKKRLNKFDEVFGRDSVEIKIYQKNIDVVKGFLEAVGVGDASKGILTQDRENESLNQAGAKFLNLVNEIYPLFKTINGVRSLSRHFDPLPVAAAVKGNGGAFFIPESWISMAIEAAQSEIEWLNQRIDSDISAYDIELPSADFEPSLSYDEQKELVRAIFANKV